MQLADARSNIGLILVMLTWFLTMDHMGQGEKGWGKDLGEPWGPGEEWGYG